MALRNGSGAGSGLIEEDDDDGGGLNARIIRRLAAGTYTIEATPFVGLFGGSETGPFTLTVGPAAQTDTTPPSLVKADVWESGNALTLEFGENMDFPIGSLRDMLSITADGAPVSVASAFAQIPGASVTLSQFAPTITRGQIVIVSYTDPSSGDDAVALQDLAGNDVASFTREAANNSTTVPVPALPAVGLGLLGLWLAGLGAWLRTRPTHPVGVGASIGVRRGA